MVDLNVNVFLNVTACQIEYVLIFRAPYARPERYIVGLGHRRSDPSQGRTLNHHFPIGFFRFECVTA